MARPAKTPAQRAADVAASADALPALIARATAIMAEHGPTDPRTLRAWEAVEVNGATVHRQSRLLAGKSKGG